MYREVRKLLKAQSIPVAESHLRLRLESHPDYPSLIAVQDTLEELTINSYACNGTKEELKNENKPFLAHFNFGEGHVQFFKDVATAEKIDGDFDKHWSGNVMFAEPAANLSGAYNSLLKKEKQQKVFGIIAVHLIIGALLSLSISAGSIPVTLLIITNCIGLYFSWLIAQKEFGISNSISEKICSMAKHSRCESVLFSKGAKLFNWLTWGDVGMVYFTSSLLFLLISQLTNQPISFYYVISLTGLVFPLYSLYYQWKVVKQWCMLCIGVLAVLFINSIISAFAINMQGMGGIAVYPVAVFTILFAIVLCSWQLQKTLYQKSLTSLSNEIKATRLKRNPEIFNALLEKQVANPINLPEKGEAIQFGNPTAPYQLVIACNPYCGPCAKAHQAVEELYEKYPDKLSVAVRFALKHTNKADKKVLAAHEIIKAAKHAPFLVIKKWYSRFNIKEIQELNNNDYLKGEKEIEDFMIWANSVKIKETPTFFLNGKRIPNIYSWIDFKEMLKISLV